MKIGGSHRNISTGLHHPSKSSTMILTLLCQMLLLDTRSLAFPQENMISPTTPVNSPQQLSLSSPPTTFSNSRASVTSNTNLAFSSSRRSSISSIRNTRSSSTKSSITSINSYNRHQPRPLKTLTSTNTSFRNRSQPTTTFTRRRRDPKTEPTSSDWLIPPTFTSPRNSGNSYGLAYRSILPIRNSNPNPHYTGLYRNRNLFSNGGAEYNGGNDNGNDGYNYNFNYNGNNEKNDINAVNLGLVVDSGESSSGVGGQNNVNILEPSFTTAESKTKSAPATEYGSISSTLEMKEEFSSGGGGGGVGQVLASRDAIGSSNIGLTLTGYNSEAPPLIIGSKTRQPKTHKSTPSNQEEEQDTAIVFPGSVYRKRPSSVRPGKSTSNPNFHPDDEYVPPPLKALDKAAFESLKLLLETRRISQNINARNSQSTSKTGGTTPTPISPLDIKGRPKCATQNGGYCDEIDTYPKDFFNKVLKNSLTLTPDVFQEVFGDSIDNKTVASDLAGRDGLKDLMLDSPLCSSIEHTIYPKVAENKDGKFMYIVNHDEYIQGVRVEKCVKEGSPCMYMDMLNGYQSACRQKYIYRKLLAFTRDGKATTDTFRLPACCVCHVRSVFVDDRINTAGFGVDASDYNPIPPPPPSSVVIPKMGGSNNNLTQQQQQDNNGTFSILEHSNDDHDHDRLSDDHDSSTATEVAHSSSNDDIIDFPTILPEQEEPLKNNSTTSLDEGVTDDDEPLITFRSF